MRSRSTCDSNISWGPINNAVFQSQMRSRSTCDNEHRKCSVDSLIVSISDEKPLHMRHHKSLEPELRELVFQSQMRSRSTCDNQDAGVILRLLFVSISDEKPLHMRQEGVSARAG